MQKQIAADTNIHARAHTHTQTVPHGVAWQGSFHKGFLIDGSGVWQGRRTSGKRFVRGAWGLARPETLHPFLTYQRRARGTRA